MAESGVAEADQLRSISPRWRCCVALQRWGRKALIPSPSRGPSFLTGVQSAARLWWMSSLWPRGAPTGDPGKKRAWHMRHTAYVKIKVYQQLDNTCTSARRGKLLQCKHFLGLQVWSDSDVLQIYISACVKRPAECCRTLTYRNLSHSQSEGDVEENIVSERWMWSNQRPRKGAKYQNCSDSDSSHRKLA